MFPSPSGESREWELWVETFYPHFIYPIVDYRVWCALSVRQPCWNKRLNSNAIGSLGFFIFFPLHSIPSFFFFFLFFPSRFFFFFFRYIVISLRHDVKAICVCSISLHPHVDHIQTQIVL